STISRWRGGQSYPRPRQLVDLARAYGQHPLLALQAADYLTGDEIDVIADRIQPPKRWTLDDFTTTELATEVLRRVKLAEEDADNGVD
ncbi:hypothetical protein U0E18_31855, partial [Burkholderia pseudomallei]|uniref:hypothetical protein n=1 Tax=Burkholderia pseudomallei TaxID=28450 RepID=UPI002AB5193C